MKIFVFLVFFLIILENFYIPEKTFNKTGDSIDQQQTDCKFGKKIYGSKFFAQSFIPQEDKITRIKLKIGRASKKTFSILNFILPFFFKFNKPDDLQVSIRDSLNGKDLASCSIPFDRAQNRSWIEFDFDDIVVNSMNKTFYIVCHTNGGDKNNCYIWFYSDKNLYSNGSSYFSEDGISWEENGSEDFCFQTFGSDKDGDGTRNYWAIIVGIEKYPFLPSATYAVNDANDMRKSLIFNGWENSHIKLLINDEATKNNISSAFRWMDVMEDADDILLFVFSGRGGFDKIITYDNYTITPGDMNKWFARMGSKNVVVIIESWYSGSFIEGLSESGRIIMTSCDKYEKSWRYSMLENSAFIYYMAKALNGDADKSRNGGNGDGVVTAEEAFRYASYLTSIYEKPQHPQIYDGYDGELPLTFLR